jgi:hypothetical protein
MIPELHAFHYLTYHSLINKSVVRNVIHPLYRPLKSDENRFGAMTSDPRFPGQHARP